MVIAGSSFVRVVAICQSQILAKHEIRDLGATRNGTQRALGGVLVRHDATPLFSFYVSAHRYDA